MKIAVSACMAPVRTSSSRPPMALGKPAAMPAKMMMEMPLPRPRSVICSPSHIRNMVPVTSVVTQVTRNIMPGSMHQAGLRFERDGDAEALHQGQADRAVAGVLGDLAAPGLAFLLQRLQEGSATVINCMMMEAEM
jgi:hypothetical protein